MKKTIFNIVQSNINGGLENVFLEYSKILQKDYRLICIISEGFVHLNKLKKLGIEVEILNIKGHFDIFSAIKLFFLRKKYSPDLMIAHNGRSFAVVNLYNKIFIKRNFKTIAVSHGGNPKRLVNFDYIITVAEHLANNIKKKYRNIDFFRKKTDMIAVIKRFEYDPFRSANIMLVEYEDKTLNYQLAPDGLSINDKVISGEKIGRAHV